MPDVCFEDAYLASLYDRLNGWGAADEFYLHLIQSAPQVLDIGCGTGALLRRARRDGHPGRLVGLDPAAGVLAVARREPGVQWVHGTLADVPFAGEFDLAVMTGHAFQVLLTDDDVRGLLADVRRVLRPGGHFAFETRNPWHGAWESWTPDHVTEIVDDAGTRIRVWHEVERVEGELVSFTETFASASWAEPRVSRSTLRFLPAERLDHLLAEAGFAVDERYGSWDRSLFTSHSPEIVTVASTVTGASAR
ncbi:MAG TPA: class I SAM-dependent methyltransferase [Jatrophihabitans sp.]|nr:class I SAM-dependent methyltransferase [Jatrophihabitans sp.]